MKAMARQRSHSIEFKRQVAQEFIAGESLYALSKRHDISRQLIRVWVQKYETGGLDEDAQAADLLQEYEAKIAALERMVGRQALEIEFLKGALKNAPRPRSVNTSVIAGPCATHGKAPAGFAPIAIGLCLTLIHLVSIPVTNTAVNPARSTGPALFVGGWALGQLWLFWIAPILGGAAGGVFYHWLSEEPSAQVTGTTTTG